ncbi:MAG: 4Fe-4S dicluster domain-containing protein, partial [Chloroflexota bacterium]
ARDLQANRGRSLVVAGDSQPPVVHALVHAINETLGNAGQTVIYTDPLEARPVNQTGSLAGLVADMAAGQVDMLVILEANPVYTAPVDLNFAENLQKVDFRVRLGLYEDETSALCHWHIPAKHYLETWGDARAYDGTVSLIQPLIEPLYEDKSAYELLAALLGQPGVSGYDIVREYWAGQNPAANFEQFWKQSLHDGFMAGTALPPKDVTVKVDALPPAEPPAAGLELTFRPDPSLWDGRFANNGWLQELPKPLTKLVWDNVALVSPATAEQLGVANETVIELTYEGRVVSGPVWVNPGQADDSICIQFGFGRTRAGRVGNGVGFNAYALRTANAPWFGSGLEIRGVARRYPLASTQHHYNMEGRDLVRVGAIAQFIAEPDFVHRMGHHDIDESLSLFPGWEYKSYAWGMTVDLNVCNGCNACVMACQSENNSPIVGKEEVITGREMHWIRLDTYFEGELDQPQAYHQPVMCQHCEQAPCEVVCPVNATVHDHEGLNVMVYNRCIGTRYCSNNCPYKVRRFNFLQYADQISESLKAQRNPDVTVRTRGVMEKCTYCVQRISAARITAKNENRTIRDGEVVTACQAACPSQAIIFGDINDPDSQVARAKAEPHHYGILTELGTRPRTGYLAKLRNPNPELEDTKLVEAP